MPFIALGTGFDILKHLAFTLSAAEGQLVIEALAQRDLV